VADGVKWNYHGTKQIGDALSIPALDEQIRKLEGFDDVFQEEMRPAVGDALNIGSVSAKQRVPVLTGDLREGIYGKLFKAGKNKSYVAGAVAVRKEIGIRGFVIEAGRWRNGKHGAERRHWRGKFYLFYGVIKNKEPIQALYAAANERIVNRLVVRNG